MKSEALDLGFAAGEQLAGFRLARLEMFNWGTFDGRIWTLRAGGRNALVTGDIGSGKSTLVDAVTTLLVPAQRAAYNKAAGADVRERTLRSYVLGYYKSERSELAGGGRPVALREPGSYSVVLAVFHNAGYGQTVTLAQLLWFKEPQGQPARLYVTAERELSIAQEFAGFDGDIAKLRRRLRAARAQVEDSFPAYGAQLRRLLGIRSDQALELFHQTVSMKSVGNLTDFVRGHMLEPFDATARIQALLAHYDDLRRAHEAVLKAKRQVEVLQPLVDDCEQHRRQTEEAARLRGAREALRPHFAGLKAGLLAQRLEQLDNELARHADKIRQLQQQKDRQQGEERELRLAIADNGGDRLQRLAADIAAQEEEKARRLEKSRRYDELRRGLGLLPVHGGEDFVHQRQACAQLRESQAQQEDRLQDELTEAKVAFAQGRQEHETLSQEIASLRARRSNIDAQQVALRAALCQAVGIAESEVPFAGELIQVRESERDWEGAAERLLRNFGLSLLVPEAHYARVAEWVDRTHLHGRLVYYRVRPAGRKAPELPALHPDSLVHKLAIRQDSPFYGWLEAELARRFDYACATSQEQFRREARAITRAGQVKAAGERHEKDDRHRIDDRGRYVLGWSNQAKIDALAGQLQVLEARLARAGAHIAELDRQLRAMRERQQALSRLEEYRDWAELDWASVARHIERLEDERARLEASSDLLKTLNARLQELQAALTATEQALDARKDQQSRAHERQAQAQQALGQARSIVQAPEAAGHEAFGEWLERLRAEVLGQHGLTVESCDNREQEMRGKLQDRIDAEDKRLARLREKIVKAMVEYKEAFRLETQEADASIEAAGEFQAMLQRLRADDLPRFEADFKRLLNENTINEIANFQSQLYREREQIKERIAQINGSLAQIDYNPARYIVLEAQAAPDADVREFQSDLRACTEGSFSGTQDEQYSEAKFLHVRRIVERFRGREGLADLDARWTRKVTDVRNWFAFAASERWREDGREHEHYSDSGGKSGGQKEKLAYTILAASLAYQFGLEWGAARSRGFRFAVIDEAFGRGSDESARYGLELFRQLGLQLLIVTPLQKIHVIEPYVASVGFVHNEGGQSSRLRNLTIEEYRAEQEARGR